MSLVPASVQEGDGRSAASPLNEGVPSVHGRTFNSRLQSSESKAIMMSQNHQGLSLLWLSSDPSAPSFMERWALYPCSGQKDGGWWQSSLLQCRLNLDTYCKEKDAVVQ